MFSKILIKSFGLSVIVGIHLIHNYIVLIKEVGVLIVLIKNYVMKNRVYHVTITHLHLMKKVNIGAIKIQNRQEMFSKVLAKNVGLSVIVDIHLMQD